MIVPVSISETFKSKALEIGFDLVGIAPINAAARDLKFSRQWVEAGYGGEMHYLANPTRDDPRSILPSAQSVVCLGLVYNTPLAYSSKPRKRGKRQKSADRVQPAEELSREEGGNPGARAWISRYAWGQDYHEVMRTKLEQLRKQMEALAPEVDTRVYVDTGPVVERAFARYSGIGWVGKNTCLIDEKKGSWFFLGVILTNLVLAPDLPAPDRCGSCTRCIEACPTGALTQPYVMDASHCIAYLTIEIKGSIPEAFRPAIGNNIFGCDICQDVCPWNSSQMSYQPPAINPQQSQRRGAATINRPEFQPLEIEVAGKEYANAEAKTLESPAPLTPPSNRLSLFNPPLRALASLGEKEFRRAFSRSPIKRAKYRGWLRNLCVAMGNSGDPSFIPWLEQATQNPDELVREHAQWALERLLRPSQGAPSTSGG